MDAAYSLLAYNISFFQIVFNSFSHSRFIKHFMTNIEPRSYVKLFAKFDFHMIDLFTKLEQVLYNRTSKTKKMLFLTRPY